MLSCRVKIGERVKVEFSGVWRKVDVDIAYGEMLRSLPVHLAKLKKENSDARREEGSSE